MANIAELIEKYSTMAGNVQSLLNTVQTQDSIIRELLDRVSALENAGNVVEARAEAAAAREVTNQALNLQQRFSDALREAERKQDATHAEIKSEIQQLSLSASETK